MVLTVIIFLNSLLNDTSKEEMFVLSVCQTGFLFSPSGGGRGGWYLIYSFISDGFNWVMKVRHCLEEM